MLRTLPEQVQTLIPEGTEVVLVGDGEFDGADLQREMNGWQRSYVCRTAKNITLYWQRKKFCLEGPGLNTEPGETFPVANILFAADRYGPVMAISRWRKDCKESIFLVTNMDCAEKACRYYEKRFRIEAFFSDSESRGFDLHKSYLSDPHRLSRLMIAVCLAYYRMVCLGVDEFRS